MAETYVTPAEVIDAWPAFANLTANRQQALIEAASAAVSNYCRRTFTQQVQVETHSGANLSRVWLRVRPVLSVSGVVANGDAIDDTGGDAWRFNPETGELRLGVGWGDVRFARAFAPGFVNVVVTYVGGFNVLPAAIKEATILTIQGLSAAGSIASGPYKSESIGDWSYTLADASSLGSGGLSSMAATLLDPYRQDEIH